MAFTTYALKAGASDYINDSVTNPNYRIWMSKGDNPKNKISTPMPDNWTTSLDISWTPQFANLLQDAAGAAIGQARAEALKNMANAAGFQSQNKTLSSNIWQGTSYMTLNIPFVFKVEKDVQSELLVPIKKLMEWALPTLTGKGFLMQAPYSPGLDFVYESIQSSPIVKKAAGDPVSVQFGNFFKLPSCVITTISQSYDSMFNSEGIPLSAKIDVSVLSTQVITYEDMQDMFRF
jgi:hypothetical protein